MTGALKQHKEILQCLDMCVGDISQWSTTTLANHHRNATVVHSYQHDIYKEFLPIAVTREQNLDFAK